MTLFKLNKIAFIGYGKMAKILVDITAGIICPASNIVVSSPSLWSGSQKTHFNVATSNVMAATGADVIILGTKPPTIESVCQEIASSIRKDTLIVSIAAGVTTHSILEKLGNPSQPIIRAMPNTPLSVKEGMTGLYKNAFITKAHEEVITKLFSAAGDVIVFDHDDSEDVINKVTAISGSGPAYFFYIQEEMIKSAINLGLSRIDAEKLVKKTMQGAAKLTKKSKLTLEEQRAQVTSKGGTTAAAIKTFETLNLNRVLDAGILAAYHRAQELSNPKDKPMPQFFSRHEETVSSSSDEDKPPLGCSGC